jgi:hypothetical protein
MFGYVSQQLDVVSVVLGCQIVRRDSRCDPHTVLQNQ